MARNLSQQQKLELKEVIESGKLQHLEIVKQYGCSTATIQRIIKAEGLTKQRGRNESSIKPMQRVNPASESFIYDSF